MLPLRNIKSEFYWESNAFIAIQINSDIFTTRRLLSTWMTFIVTIHEIDDKRNY